MWICLSFNILQWPTALDLLVCSKTFVCQLSASKEDVKKVIPPHKAEGGILQQEKNPSFLSVPKTILEVIFLVIKMHGSWINILVIDTG